MRSKSISTVQGLIDYISEHSNWSAATIRNVTTALGCRTNGGLAGLKKLSSSFTDCAKHGADSGFPGFTYYNDTLKFFKRNRQDIINNLESVAEEYGGDLIEIVQHFGVFRYDTIPSAADIGRALWDTAKMYDDLTILYNVFSWFCLEEISYIWYRYLEDNPGYYTTLTA